VDLAVTVVIALLLGLGVFMVYDGATRTRLCSSEPRLSARIERGLATAGLGQLRPAQFLGASVGVGLAVGAVAIVIVGSLAVACIGAVAGAVTPAAYSRARSRSVHAQQRRDWPDAIELLAGAVRAGDTVPAAIAVVADRGPTSLRPVFRGVVSDHRVAGDLVGALERMGAAAADPIADRVVRTLALAHRVGGRALGDVLRTLAGFLREDLANRREIESRQSWIVVAARVAAAAPWLVLVLVASRPQGARAFDSPAGVVVLLVGAVVTVAGYRSMLRLGRLPEEPRALAGPRR
jgi:tight adherence protein B